MKFFEELFSGQLHPIEDVTTNNPEYKLKAKELALYSARLEGALTEEQKELLWQYRDTHSDITNILQTEAYRIESKISGEGFEVHRLKKPEIKRILALYFDASMQGDTMPDIDGEQYFQI